MRPKRTSWQDEQEAWKKTAVLFDQSWHMTDVYFDGPDVERLFPYVGLNSFAAFGANKAKQLVACSEDGYLVGDAILFVWSDRRYKGNRLLFRYQLQGSLAWDIAHRTGTCRRRSGRRSTPSRRRDRHDQDHPQD